MPSFLATISDYFKAIIILLLVASLSGLITLKLSIFQKRELISTPDIREQNIADAIELLDKLELELVIKRFKASDTVTEGSIITQDPFPNESIRRGERVKAVISQGSSSIILPDTTGLFYKNALELLASLKIKNVKLIFVSSNATKGIVLAGNSKVGTVVEPNDRIALLVSDGDPSTYIVTPDFSGKTLDGAIDQLEGLGLKLSKVIYATDNQLAGTVVSHSPAPMSKVAIGGLVELVVSKGGPPIRGDASYSFLHYNLKDIKEKVRLKIIQENDDGKKEIYSKTHKSDDLISLLVTIRGDTLVRILIDDRVVDVKRFGE